MIVTVVGGKPESVEVEEQDGKYVSADGTEYVLEHVSGVYTFVRKAEEVIDEVESLVEDAEEALAGGLEAEPVSEEPKADDVEPVDAEPVEEPQSGFQPGAIQGDDEATPEA